MATGGTAPGHFAQTAPQALRRIRWMNTSPDRARSVVIADDHLLVRAGIRMLLESLGYVVAGEASDGVELVELARTHRPAIVVADVAMPRKTGLQAIAEIRAEQPAVVALVVSSHEAAEAVRLAFDSGADAFLVKDFALPELEQALQATLRGDKYISPRITAAVLGALQGATRAPAALTARQLDILRLVAMGRTNKEAARELGISPKTVDVHRTELMRRLDLHDTAALTRHAMRLGLLAPG